MNSAKQVATNVLDFFHQDMRVCVMSRTRVFTDYETTLSQYVKSDDESLAMPVDHWQMPTIYKEKPSELFVVIVVSEKG